MRTIWKIFARQPRARQDSQDYACEYYRAGVIAVGWSKLGDLNKFASREGLKGELAKIYREETRGRPNRLAQWAGSLWKFRTSVKAGHIVACPDRESGRLYVGRVLSRRVFHDKSMLGGGCDFAHRRKVRWSDVLDPAEIRSIWPDRRFGGEQTVSQINSGGDRLWALIGRGRKTFVRRRGLPSRPDMEWGRAAECRAMEWLKERGYEPQNVAHLNCGWDIACGSDKFEVKGRKSATTAIRLTENEWRSARHLKSKYTLLIFTAPTLETLKRARPVQIPDPTRTAEWGRRVTFEYILSE